MTDAAPLLFSRPDLAWMEVTGPDRVRFLHALLTNDVLGVPPGEGNRNLLLTSKGRLTADCLMLVEETRILLGCAAGAREGLLAALDHYLVADDVELAPLSLSTWQLLGTPGELLGDGPLPDEEHQHADHLGVRLVAHALGSERGWLLLSEGGLPASLAALTPGEPAQLEARRIAAGEVAWESELARGVFPQEVGLEGYLHALKGCYLGQETMVRLTTQGHANWCTVGLSLEGGLPTVGDAIVVPGESGKAIGEITSSAMAPASGHPIALARLRHEHAEPGTELTVNAAAPARTGETYTQELWARVVALPFAD